MTDLISSLLEEIPISRDDLSTIIATASRRYKVYSIPKKSGAGMRVIAQPAPEVKILQKILVEKIICDWPVHSAATAYRLRSSIRAHVAIHADSRYLLKLDFRNFFPSIGADDIRRHAIRYSNLSEIDLKLLTRILCWRNKETGEYCLSVGAPSSPFVSNSVVYDLDATISDICSRRNIAYSRYADDLAFSTSAPNVLDNLRRELVDVLNALPYPRLLINDQKTVNVSRRFKRTLVGLTLTADGKVSLGRDRKRTLRAQVHAFCADKLLTNEVDHLNGMLAFAWSIEPTFVTTLLSRYSLEKTQLLRMPFAGMGYRIKSV